LLRRIKELDNIYAIQQNYRTLEADLAILCRYIDLTEEDYHVNSAEVRKLMLASCSMIESMLPDIKASINTTETRENKSESIPKYIFRITEFKKLQTY
jgi:hypothetical protein